MVADKENMIEVLRDFPEMVKKAKELGDDITTPKEFVDNIIIAGMGGSGFTGDLLRSYLKDVPIQIHVIKDYTLPSFVTRKSLIFAISYSGNTEETIAAYRSAIRRGCKVIAITSGGKLEELSKMNKNPIVIVPKGIQPRLSTPYLFIPILNILSYSGIIEDQEKIIDKTYRNLKDAAKKIESSTKEFAANIKGKVPVIYASSGMFSVAEKWKTDINENAKTESYYNMFPEFNHNEICSYENQLVKKHIIILSDTEDHERIKGRIKIFKKLMKKYDISLTEIAIKGDNLMSRILSCIWMGSYFSYFLAMEYEIDPTPVKIIEDLKKELAK